MLRVVKCILHGFTARKQQNWDQIQTELSPRPVYISM